MHSGKMATLFLQKKVRITAILLAHGIYKLFILHMTIKIDIYIYCPIIFPFLFYATISIALCHCLNDNDKLKLNEE